MRPLAAIPPELAGWGLVLKSEGRDLEYNFEAEDEARGIPALLHALSESGIAFTDLQTRQSSLEDIFVSLVSEAA